MTEEAGVVFALSITEQEDLIRAIRIQLDHQLEIKKLPNLTVTIHLIYRISKNERIEENNTVEDDLLRLQ